MFLAAAMGLASPGMQFRQPRVEAVMKRTMFRSGQFALRTSIFVLVAMVYLADRLGLDIILGAFAAGFVIGLVGGPEEQDQLYVKLESIGFGVLRADILHHHRHHVRPRRGAQRAGAEAAAAVRRPVSAGARAARRYLFYRRDLPGTDRPAFALLSATTLPLVVAITSTAVQRGDMGKATAAAMVGAGMVTVLVFPPLALRSA